MIPTSCHEINGSRPPSLKLAGESHSIKKTTSCNVVKHPRRIGREAPVIIYAHSPKVIHARAEDFMALVQRLTGLDEVIRRDPNDVSESSSSVVTEEANVVGDDDMNQERQLRQNLADIPLFTPSSMTLFGSPTQFLYLSPNRTHPV
uniref:Protein MKS1 n=1 Tax=Noccaea caerulescens TaxID=107243 RepID=A0A1J3JNF9_NOCCA